MATDTKTQTRSAEDNTSARAPTAPVREKSLERDYPEAQRKVGENRTDADAPRGPVNIPVKK